jgi:hypothetical protein
MKPYSESPRCEKCGGTEATRMYYPSATSLCCCEKLGCHKGGEHHHVTCKSCHYMWAESLWPGEPEPKVEPLAAYVPTPFTVAYVRPKCPHCGQEFNFDLPWPWANTYTVTP